MSDKKKCSACGKQLSTDKFNKDKRTPSGMRYECKACQYKAQIKSLTKKVRELGQ